LEFSAAKNLAPSNLDLIWLISYSCRALQQKLYCQDYQAVDHLKCILLNCRVR